MWKIICYKKYEQILAITFLITDKDNDGTFFYFPCSFNSPSSLWFLPTLQKKKKHRKWAISTPAARPVARRCAATPGRPVGPFLPPRKRLTFRSELETVKQRNLRRWPTDSPHTARSDLHPRSRHFFIVILMARRSLSGARGTAEKISIRLPLALRPGVRGRLSGSRILFKSPVFFTARAIFNNGKKSLTATKKFSALFLNKN